MLFRSDMAEAEALLELVDLRRQRRRIAGVAVEHFDGDRAAIRRAEQAVDDLQGALPAVAAVAALGERAAAAFHVARRHVVEHQRPALQVALGQRGLDRALALEEKIERGVELVLADVAQGQLDAEAGGGGDRIERLGGGELGGRAMMRLTIMARTRSRGRLDSSAFRGPMIVSRPMARVAPSTAATWP